MKGKLRDISKSKSEAINIWDSSIPVEKSAYVYEKGFELYNIDNLKIQKDSLTMVDLFCGAGGFSVGCSWAGFYPVLGLDYLKPAVDTWRKNHPKSISCLGDILQADPVKLKQLLKEKGVKRINLITGGIPCQGFSIANRKHNDNDNRNFLFLEYMWFVEVFVPDYIIIENVSGLRNTAGGQFEKNIQSYMERLDYTVTVDMVNAVEYGVPQQRLRLLFIGVKNNRSLSAPYQIPHGNYKSPKLYRTVESAISDLPGLDNNEQKTNYNSKPQNEYQALMRGYGDIPISKPLSLYNHVSPNHSVEAIQKINSTQQGMPMYKNFKQRITS